MHLERWLMACLLPGLLWSTAGCKGTDEVPAAGVSTKQRVQRKPGVVWGRDLATGLGLHPWELCAELGGSDCIGEAHLVTLGGVEPERLGIDDPIPNALVSAPIAVDRVAISACGERFERDKQGSAVIFGPVLDDDSEENRVAVATSLVQRLLSRHPTEAETRELAALHATLKPVSDQLLRDWSVGACVVVATSTEALFY